MKSFWVALFLVFSLGVFAQGGAVRLDEASQYAIGNQRARDKVSGYRVCVFSDNSQSARGAASAAISQLESNFDLDANVVYQNPFFKVYTGYCINRLEASILLGRLKSFFPAAFIVREQMPIGVLKRGGLDKVGVAPSEGSVDDD